MSSITSIVTIISSNISSSSSSRSSSNSSSSSSNDNNVRLYDMWVSTLSVRGYMICGFLLCPCDETI